MHTPLRPSPSQVRQLYLYEASATANTWGLSSPSGAPLYCSIIWLLYKCGSFTKGLIAIKIFPVYVCHPPPPPPPNIVQHQIRHLLHCTVTIEISNRDSSHSRPKNSHRSHPVHIYLQDCTALLAHGDTPTSSCRPHHRAVRLGPWHEYSICSLRPAPQTVTQTCICSSLKTQRMPP
jgi:hypothetical protein